MIFWGHGVFGCKGDRLDPVLDEVWRLKGQSASAMPYSPVIRLRL